jgi:hemerythrin-like metal-binding protein
MPLIAWEAEMSIGVLEMDDEHRKLIAMINGIGDGVASGQGRDELGGQVDRLVEFTKKHLAHEERLLAEAGYAESDVHHREHDQMIAKTLSLQAAFRWGSVDLIRPDLTNFVCDWLASHIQGSDKAYGAFLNSKGIF